MVAHQLNLELVFLLDIMVHSSKTFFEKKVKLVPACGITKWSYFLIPIADYFVWISKHENPFARMLVFENIGKQNYKYKYYES